MFFGGVRRIPLFLGSSLDCLGRRHFCLEDGMAALAERKRLAKKARAYAQELRDLRKRLNVKPLERIPYDIAARP